VPKLDLDFASPSSNINTIEPSTNFKSPGISISIPEDIKSPEVDTPSRLVPKTKAEREEESGIIYLDLSLVEEDPDTDDQSIVEALTGSEFRYVVTEHLYDNLVQAIKKEKNSFIAFRLAQQGEDYILEERQYKNLLKTILNMAEEDEDYMKCAAVKKLIETL